MKILHCITSLQTGGAERALFNLVRAMPEHEHHIAYIYPGPFVASFAQNNIPTTNIKGFLFRYDLWTYWSLCSLIKTYKPYVIHTSLWAANQLGRYAGRKFGIPVISALHGNCADEGRVRNWIERYTAHKSHALIAVSDTVAQSYRNTITATPSRLVTINNGINPSEVRTLARTHKLTRSDLGIPENAFVIGSVGRLEPIKRYDLLLRAFALMQTTTQCFLFIVGDGSQKLILNSLAKELGIANHVIFAGHQTNPYPLYPLFDCFVLSSQSEGLSIALLEALSLGLPVVSTHQSTQHDVIQSGTNGVLVEPDNPQALAQALTDLWQNPAQLQAMRTTNINLVDTQFHIATTAQKYASLFTQKSNVTS